MSRHADYYAERAREFGARYLETGDRIDFRYAAYFTRLSLRAELRSQQAKMQRDFRGRATPRREQPS